MTGTATLSNGCMVVDGAVKTHVCALPGCIGDYCHDDYTHVCLRCRGTWTNRSEPVKSARLRERAARGIAMTCQTCYHPTGSHGEDGCQWCERAKNVVTGVVPRGQSKEGEQ
jgi:hypothetical protein